MEKYSINVLYGISKILEQSLAIEKIPRTKELWTSGDAASFLKCKISKIKELIETHQIPCSYTKGGQIRIKPFHIVQYIERQKSQKGISVSKKPKKSVA